MPSASLSVRSWMKLGGPTVLPGGWMDAQYAAVSTNRRNPYSKTKVPTNRVIQAHRTSSDGTLADSGADGRAVISSASFRPLREGPSFINLWFRVCSGVPARKGFPGFVATADHLARSHGRPRPLGAVSADQARGPRGPVGESAGPAAHGPPPLRSAFVPRAPRSRGRGTGLLDQLRGPRGHGLHRRRQPLRWRIRPRGSETVDPLRIRPSEANEESEAGRRTARVEMGNGRHENPSAPSTVRRERLRGRKAARPPEDLPDRRATPNAGHDPHRHIDLPRCSIEVRRPDGHRRRGPRFPGSHHHHGPWRPTSLVRHGLLSVAAPRERLPGHLEHSAATPPGMVPATRGYIGQGPLRLRLAGARNPGHEGRD